MDLQFTIHVEADEEGWAELMGSPFIRENVGPYFIRQFEAEMDRGLANRVDVTLEEED